MKVLDYMFVSQLSSFSSKLFKMKKLLWKDNRKCYNKIKNQAKEIDSIKEKTTYYVMSSSELQVTRGLSILKDLKDITEVYITALTSFSNEKTVHFLDELNTLMDELEAARVMMQLSEHEDSFFMK